MTFALSTGDALETPTWRAILPELVPKDDLAAASALNGIEFNLARAVGPALAGIVITVAGIAAAFVVNFVSFFGVILLVARRNRPIRKRTEPPETLTGATVAAIRYVRHSPAILTVLLRTGVVMFFSSVLFALLPTLARNVNKTAIGYGILLGCFGFGAIAGAFAMRSARGKVVDASHCVDWRADFGVGDCNDQHLTQLERTLSRDARWRCGLDNLDFTDQRYDAEPCPGLGTSTSTCDLHPGLSGELRSRERDLGRHSPTMSFSVIELNA